MTIATITHDVSGVRIKIDSLVRQFGNQAYLAESHAELLISSQRTAERLKRIKEVLGSGADDHLKLARILAAVEEP